MLSSRFIGLPLALVLLYLFFGGSLALENVYDLKMSDLALVERFCTVGAIFFITIALVVRGRFFSKCIDCACVVLALGAIICGMHLGIQYGFIDEPDVFKTPIPFNVSVGEFQNLLLENEMKSCKYLGPLFFGYPISAYSAVMFIFVFFYMSAFFKDKDELGNKIEETKKD